MYWKIARVDHYDLVRAIDKGHVTALLLELSRAFDTVNHELLIEVLKKRCAIVLLVASH